MKKEEKWDDMFLSGSDDDDAFMLFLSFISLHLVLCDFVQPL